MNRTGRIGFVPPRYGKEVVGGAEAVLKEIAHGFAERGWEVEILTTCARDHFTWSNEYPAGVEEDGKVLVRRFPTVLDTPRVERAQIEQMILTGQQVDIELQQRWINDDLRVPELYHHLVDHAADYRALVFAPYLFWTTFACSQIAPDRTIVHPSLHDEPQAALEIFQPVLTGARGIWVQTEPERDLVDRLFPRHAPCEMVGSGIDVPDHYDVEGFRSRYGLGERRFVVYAGRREGGKRWEWLLEVFGQVALDNDLPLDLVTFGTGDVTVPAAIADRVVDLGFLPNHERNNAFAAAEAYLQPSPYESFSRSVMEAWLAGTLVVANAGCDVVRWHCERSGAGIVFDDAFDLEQCLRFVAERPGVTRELAAKGRDYVLDNYTWPQVLDRMESTIERWLPV